MVISYAFFDSLLWITNFKFGLANPKQILSNLVGVVSNLVGQIIIIKKTLVSNSNLL